MSEEHEEVEESPTIDTQHIEDGVSPDELLGHFKGRKVITVILVALVLHAVVIFGTSYSFLKNQVFGPDTTEMSKEEKLKVAVAEATSALGDIAERHNISVDELIAKFATTGSRSSKISEEGSSETKETAPPAGAVDESPAAEADEEKSAIEKNLATPKEGPDIGEEKIDDDLGL